MIATLQPPNSTAVEIDHTRAAERLILGAHRVLNGKRSFDEIFAGWRELIVEFRNTEKRCLIDQEATPEHLESHRRAMNAMIFCADCLMSAASRHMETIIILMWPSGLVSSGRSS